MIKTRLLHILKTSLQFIEAHGEETVSMFSLMLLSSCIFLQVVARYIFHVSIPWAAEVAVYGMAWSVYMGAAAAVRERAHLRITNLIYNIPRTLAIIIALFADLLWIFFNILMIKISLNYIVSLWDRPHYSQALSINQFWPQLCVILGFFLMTLRIFQIYYKWYKSGFEDLPL